MSTSLEEIEKVTHKTLCRLRNPETGFWSLPGEGPALLTVQDKLFAHFLVVRPATASLITSLSREEISITTWKFGGPSTSDTWGKMWGSIAPEGQWSILTEKGVVVSQFGYDVGFDTKNVVGIHNNGYFWNRTTAGGGRSFGSSELPFFGGQHVLMPDSYKDRAPPLEPYQGMTFVREGGIDGRGRVPIFSQEKIGAPIHLWRCNLRHDCPKNDQALLCRSTRVGEGRILWDVHPTLESFVVKNTLVGEVFEAHGDGWSMTPRRRIQLAASFPHSTTSLRRRRISSPSKIRGRVGAQVLPTFGTAP